MEAKVLLRDSPEVNTRHVEKIMIFDDCITCGKQRMKGKIMKVVVKMKCEHINNIACDCSVAISYDNLAIEHELITIIEAAGIHIER